VRERDPFVNSLPLASVQAFYGPRFLNAFTYDILIRQDAQGFQIAEAILYTKPFFAEHTVLIHSRSKEAKAAMEGLWYQIQHDLKIGIQSEHTLSTAA
jgi:hypothetical protein